MVVLLDDVDTDSEAFFAASVDPVGAPPEAGAGAPKLSKIDSSTFVLKETDFGFGFVSATSGVSKEKNVTPPAAAFGAAVAADAGAGAGAGPELATAFNDDSAASPKMLAVAASSALAFPPSFFLDSAVFPVLFAAVEVFVLSELSDLLDPVSCVIDVPKMSVVGPVDVPKRSADVTAGAAAVAAGAAGAGVAADAGAGVAAAAGADVPNMFPSFVPELVAPNIFPVAAELP